MYSPKHERGKASEWSGAPRNEMKRKTTANGIHYFSRWWHFLCWLTTHIFLFYFFRSFDLCTTLARKLFSWFSILGAHTKDRKHRERKSIDWFIVSCLNTQTHSLHRKAQRRKSSNAIWMLLLALYIATTSTYRATSYNNESAADCFSFL